MIDLYAYIQQPLGQSAYPALTIGVGLGSKPTGCKVPCLYVANK